MKTLVIHPSDPTTHFLSEIYINTDWTIISDQHPAKSMLKGAIKAHDRIVMMGHGTEYGLSNGSKTAYVIDSRWVQMLREKDCVCIWCNADGFVEKYGLSGFYTGMIISEFKEAVMWSVMTNNESLKESNLLFAKAIKESIHLTPREMKKKVLEIYEGNTPVIRFNRINILSTEKEL